MSNQINEALTRASLKYKNVGRPSAFEFVEDMRQFNLNDDEVQSIVKEIGFSELKRVLVSLALKEGQV